MADIKYPEAQYKVAVVGPTDTFSFKGNDGGDVQLTSYSLQLEGVAEWVKLSQKPDAPAPTQGESIEGHIEDTGKYGLKFVKKRAGGGFGGGKSFSAGAAWANAVQTATTIVAAHYTASGTKPANSEEFLTRIEGIAPKVKAMIDKFAGQAPATGQQEITKESLGTGNPNDAVVINDVDEKELDW